MRVLEIFLLGIIFLFFFSFSDFCVKRSDGVSGCPDGAVVSSGGYSSLFGRAC
jgi:hypothetical protein